VEETELEYERVGMRWPVGDRRATTASEDVRIESGQAPRPRQIGARRHRLLRLEERHTLEHVTEAIRVLWRDLLAAPS
jgi:hypothetical protein